MKTKLPQSSSRSSRQTGSALLEALIAILIFSMGILAIVGMQAAAVKASGDAKYRSDAGILVNQLLGEMWVADRTPATLQTNFQGGGGTDGAQYTTWFTRDVQGALPGAAANPPTVVVNTATSQVTITVQWMAPGEPATATPHSYTVVTQIK
ncbi:MAG: prepilin-type cleavage/methylation domain-containing protein [Betaproteobacteria bacterium]|nr:prepilin-type cleavage/methylation domain-containing protein [Betaproteobacteria bacterium]